MPHTLLLIEKIVDKIKQELSDQLMLLFTTKHVNPGEDIDLFIILDKAPFNDPYNVKAYIRLISAIKDIEQSIEKELSVEIIDFSTFRIEEYHVPLLQSVSTSTKQRLHLLVYPTLEHFLLWENPSIIASLSSHHTILHGDENTLKNLKTNIEIEHLERRVQPLISLLFETYRNIKTYKASNEEISHVLIEEGIKKLIYTLKFTLWELLRENVKYIPPTDLEEIIKLSKIDNLNPPMVDLLIKVTNLNMNKMSLIDILKLYEEAMFIIEEAVNQLKKKEVDNNE